MEKSSLEKLSKKLDTTKLELGFVEKVIFNFNDNQDINLIYHFYGIEQYEKIRDIIEKYETDYDLLNMGSSSGYNEEKVKEEYGIDFEKMNEEDREKFRKNGFIIISIRLK